MDINTLKNRRGEVDLTYAVLLPAFVISMYVVNVIETASVAGYSFAGIG